MKKWLAMFFLMGSLGLAQTAKTPEVVPVDQEPMHKLVFENEYVRVFSVEVPPGGETKYHRHERDYVGVMLGDSQVESVRLGELPLAFTFKDGEARFTKGGFVHKAVNKGAKPFRNVTVELKVAIVGQSGLGGVTNVDGHSSRTMVLVAENVQCKVIKGWNAVRSWDLLDPQKKSLSVAAGPAVLAEQPGAPSSGEFSLGAGEFKWTDSGYRLHAVSIGDSPGLLVCEFVPIKEPQGPSRQKAGARDDKAESHAPK